MHVNRLGYKVLTELGYKSIKACYEANNLDCSYDAFYKWCVGRTSPSDRYSLCIDKLAGMLDVHRNDVLNMIASKPTFDIPVTIRGVYSTHCDNLFKQKRVELGLTAKELGEIIGCDQQMIADIENGKRCNFPDNEIAKNYIELLDISFTQFQNTISALRHDNQLRDSERRKEKEINKGSETMLDKIYDTAEGKEKDWEYKTKCTVGETPKVEEITEKPHREDKPLLPAEDMQTVMSLLYGKLDFATFKKVENILMGVI